jgi:hypothetical protein
MPRTSDIEKEETGSVLVTEAGQELEGNVPASYKLDGMFQPIWET